MAKAGKLRIHSYTEDKWLYINIYMYVYICICIGHYRSMSSKSMQQAQNGFHKQCSWAKTKSCPFHSISVSVWLYASLLFYLSLLCLSICLHVCQYAHLWVSSNTMERCNTVNSARYTLCSMLHLKCILQGNASLLLVRISMVRSMVQCKEDCGEMYCRLS